MKGISVALPIKLDMSHGLAELGGEPHVFHCHHYNCFLQKVVEDQSNIVDSRALLTRPAVEVVMSELQRLGSDRAGVEEIFRTLGFGKLDLSGITAKGGTAKLSSSHYAMGWLSKFGKSTSTVCHFAAGFAEAAARHLFRTPFAATETKCTARGDAHCEISIVPGGVELGASPGMGALATFGPRPAFATQTSIDEGAIIQACAGLPLSGDAEGLVHAFGVSLTRHYANYYNLLSFRFVRAMEKVGEVEAMAAQMQLVEAGRVCAFNTFGGIMESAEWEGLIKPQCKTREDWAFGMVAVVNALGWGRWSIAELKPGSRLELVVDGSYESNGYVSAFGHSKHPRCYLATGGAAGLMNLIYNADITQRPDLTPEFYEKTFQSAGVFVSREVECRAQGASACRFVAERL